MSIAPKLGPDIDAVLERLYASDHEQRRLGLSVDQRTRNIDIESGRYLFILALGMEAKTIVEIGSSNGVSTIWWAAAMQRTGGHVTGTDVRTDRVEEANANLAEAGLAEFGHLELITPEHQIVDVHNIDLLFIDAEKDDYSLHFDRYIDAVRPGGLILADNVTSHDCSIYQAKIRERADIETVTVTLDRGIEFSVKL
ncbi:MAG: O-methyltransferase [Thermomicrobiales bacterium]